MRFLISFILPFVFYLDCWSNSFDASNFLRESWKPRTRPSECTPIDIRNNNPALRNHWDTPRDQDGVGWCYAFAASDVLTSVMGVPVSAADLSYSYLNKVSENSIQRLIHQMIGQNKNGLFEVGFVRPVLKHAELYGICEEARLPSQSFMVSTQGKDIIDAINILDEIKKRITSQRTNNYLECINSDELKVIKQFFPGIDAKAVVEIIKSNYEDSLNQILYNISEKYCGIKRRKAPSQIRFKSEVIGLSSYQSLFTAMDRALINGTTPAISGQYRMYDHKSDFISGHSAVVLARRFSRGKCQYLIRNSWGRGCNGYDHPNLRKEDCDAKTGTLWMDEAHIKKYIKMVDYAEKVK
jgi:hypothetical protein